VNNGLNISIFSKALYSNWCHDKTRNILFDAGEGAATSIGNHLAGIDKIFITHDHGDHTLGLPSIVGCRNAGRGMSRNKDTMDANKPLTVYYPEDNYLMSDLIKFVKARTDGWLRYGLKFIPISAGFELDIGNKQFVRAFNMKHQKNKTTLGYVIYENRTRLKKEYQGLDIPSFIRKGMKSSDFNETYRANLFAYCLDAYQIPDYDQLYDVKDIIMDCTFFNLEDRDDPTHFTLDEAYDFCQGIRAKNIYMAHISGRYNYNDIVNKNNNSAVTYINPYRVNDL
jgi:ribonuclease Z